MYNIYEKQADHVLWQDFLWYQIISFIEDDSSYE